jgi:hypothetical protein
MQLNLVDKTIYIEQNKNKSSNKQKNKATIIIFARISIIKH